MEIRGWKVPIVQGTQEKRRNTARTNLNVASTVGFFQPRISNPWLLSYLAFAVMCPGNFLPRSRAAADYRDPFAAAEGKYTDAVKNQTRGFRVAQQVSSDPTLINYLVGVACDSIALSGTRDVLTQAGPNAEVAAEVLQAIKISHAPLSLRTALAGDMAL